MKIGYCSDLHLEFGPISLENDGIDLLILAGDVQVSQKIYTNKFDTFFEECNNRFKKVLYVMGNHDFYCSEINKAKNDLRNYLSQYQNIQLLDNEFVDIDGIRFLGGTMWADCNNFDPITRTALTYGMNDFRLIYDGGERFDPFSMAELHIDFKHFITDNLSDKNVIITHHSPSRLSTREKYKDDYELNGGYSSNLDDFIIDNPNISHWIHGHTHDVFDYFIGTTNILCNPRGYIGIEDQAYNFELKYFEV